MTLEKTRFQYSVTLCDKDIKLSNVSIYIVPKDYFKFKRFNKEITNNKEKLTRYFLGWY